MTTDKTIYILVFPVNWNQADMALTRLSNQESAKQEWEGLVASKRKEQKQVKQWRHNFYLLLLLLLFLL